MTWPLRSLGDVALVQGGRTPKKLDAYLADNPRSDRSVPFYKVGDMNAGPTLSTARTLVASDELQSLGIIPVPRGTLVFPKAGGAIATNKKRSVTVPGPVDLNCMAVTAGPELDPQYLRLWFESVDLTSIADGSVLPQISKRRASELQIPLPSLAEQHRIVDLLEDHLSRVDAANAYLEAAQRRSNVLYDQLLASALAALESAELPLAELLADGLANGKSVPTQENGFPVLRLTALRDGHIDLAERKPGAWTAADARRFLVKRGDFLIARGNGSLRLVGRGGLIIDEPDAVAFPDTLIRARPDPTRIDPEFMAYVWNAPGVRRQIEKAAKTTAGIYKVNQKDLAAVRVPVPSLADQERVTAAVRESRDALSRLALEVGRAVARSSALRRSLLGAAFSGRLSGDASDQSEAEEMINA